MSHESSASQKPYRVLEAFGFGTVAAAVASTLGAPMERSRVIVRVPADAYKKSPVRQILVLHSTKKSL
jgi:hypothetical protein